MVVDGTLAEAAWGSVSDLRPFVTLSGGPAKNQTTARVLRSRDTLYIAFTCRFAQGAELKTHQTRRDGDVWLDESVEVFVDPGVSLRKYRHFVLNAAGVQRDEAGDKAATPPFDADWNGTWRAATSRDATAWHAEIAIPFSDLGLKPGKPALVGLNLCRNDQTAVDTTCWSPTQSGFHEPVRFGLLSLPVQRPAALVMTAETPRRARLGKGALSMAVGNTAASVVSGTVTVIAGNERGRSETAVAVAGLAPGETRSVDCAYELSQSGDNGIVAVLRDGQGSSVAATRFAASLPVPREAPKYGHRLAGGEALSVWWAESMHKVHRGDSLPETATSEVQLSAAGNEYEAVQIVLRPPADAEVALSVSDFVGAAG
ncbi:MAG: hypothetical protein FJ000_08415, partial [Actinobacteria bacterium]|nr:hypothetical protein [Actinomycetota bacterium]